MEKVLNGTEKGKFYEGLAQFTDKFGPRLTGSRSLEDSIDFMLTKWKTAGFNNAHTEPVPCPIPTWERKEERAVLTSPRHKVLDVVALGWSAPTQTGGITADVLVVKTKAELEARSAEARGKIVVFAYEKWNGYDDAVKYRTQGAYWASDHGALAVLVKSIGSDSLYNAHTGSQKLRDDTKQSYLPAAAITLEDAAFLQRLQDRGEKITIQLTLNSVHGPLTNLPTIRCVMNVCSERTFLCVCIAANKNTHT